MENDFNVLVNSIKSDLKNEFDKFSNDCVVAGTFQLPEKKYSSKKITKELEDQKRKFEKSRNNYKIFFDAVFDRLEFYEDLLWFSCLLISNSANIEKYSKKFLRDDINPILQEISGQINNSLTGLNDSSISLVNYLENESKNIRRKFDQHLLPKLINKVSGNEVSKVLSEFSSSLETNVQEFEKEYSFVKPDNLVYRIKKDQLKKFSPKDIIIPIVLKKIENSIKKIDNNFTVNVSKLNTTIIGLARIVEYNLDSAKIKFEEENDRAESIKIAQEGLQRTLNKSEDFEIVLSKSLAEVDQSLTSEIKEVLDDLISLSNIDRLITIKLQVTKEKAIREAKENIQVYYGKLKKSWSELLIGA